MAKESHAVMPSSLARALIAAGVRHYDAGGGVGPTTTGGIGGFLTPQSQFRATVPVISTENFLPQRAALEGEQQDIYNEQKNLAQALLARSQGQGPDPALTELNNETGNNVAATAALIGGARGASANPGLTARLAAQQGAATQQKGVGQAATLKAQEELGADQALSQLYGTQAGTNTSNLGVIEGANASQNSALTTGALGTGEINAQTAANNAKNSASTTGGVIGGIAGALGLANGGRVPFGRALRMADGGMVNFSTPVDPHLLLNVDATKPNQSIADALSKRKIQIPNLGGSGDGGEADPMDLTPGATDLVNPVGGGSADPMDLTPGATAGELLASKGGKIDFRDGGNVPGRAKFKGDSAKNDTVPALLSPDEEVLPRSVTMAPDAPERAKRFVEALQESKGEGKGYAKVLKAKKTLKERVEQLEKLCAGGMA